MLNHLSWTIYFESVAVVLVFYYAFVGLRFYRIEIERLLSRRETGASTLPDQLIYKPDEIQKTEQPVPVTVSDQQLAQEIISEADDFILRLKECIRDASARPFAPGVLIRELQTILTSSAARSLADHRPAINELIASECERTGTAQVTEDEVDRWWGN